MKKILVGCEYSGRVRDQFIKNGLFAISCDILETESEGPQGPHHKGEIQDILYDDWLAIIAFPPCTHLCSSGARWFKEKKKDGRQQKGIDFFMLFANHSCKYIAIENPIGIMSTFYRKPDQIIQPWQFGHGETKSTCLWLKGLPKLKSTNIVEGRENRIHKIGPSKKRSKIRSLTYLGIAEAMGKQWGDFLKEQK
jgi:hypothetical protein